MTGLWDPPGLGRRHTADIPQAALSLLLVPHYVSATVWTVLFLPQDPTAPDRPHSLLIKANKQNIMRNVPVNLSLDYFEKGSGSTLLNFKSHLFFQLSIDVFSTWCILKYVWRAGVVVSETAEDFLNNYFVSRKKAEHRATSGSLSRSRQASPSNRM